MFAFVGLGNPGAQYQANRHNIGFLLIEFLAQLWQLDIEQSRFASAFRRANLEGQTVFFLRPMTFMNLSGKSVMELLRFYKLKPEKILVIHDEIDLPFGKIKVKQGGNHAGHNGLKSIDAAIGVNYWRLRIGVGRPEHRSMVSSWVLGDFEHAQQESIMDLFALMAPLMKEFWCHPTEIARKLSSIKI